MHHQNHTTPTAGENQSLIYKSSKAEHSMLCTFVQVSVKNASHKLHSLVTSLKIQLVVSSEQNDFLHFSGINAAAYPHHFADHAAEFHHAHTHAHNIHNQLLATSAAAAVASHSQRSAASNGSHNNGHVMLSRSNHSTATSTAAAVAAAMMLDPRFHHNTSVRLFSPKTFLAEIDKAVNVFLRLQAYTLNKAKESTGVDGKETCVALIVTKCFNFGVKLPSLDIFPVQKNQDGLLTDRGFKALYMHIPNHNLKLNEWSAFVAP